MPVVRLKHIVSCSSEDPNNPAENLLTEEVYRKWRCAHPGEKQLTAVIQFEKSSQIQSIDIGNEGSAFVEVLVSRSSSSVAGQEAEFQVLLVASAFMSPAESKTWTNFNRVRMFGKDKLSKSTADEKWDRVKIVCTQPYNKKETYGLSFVKFHSTSVPQETSAAAASSSAAPKKLGAFTIRDDEPAVSTGSLLFKRSSSSKDERPSSPPSSSPSMSVAAHARMASVAALREREEREKGQGCAEDSSGDCGTGSGGIRRKEEKASSTSATTVSSSSSSSSSASKPTGSGLKRQVTKTVASTDGKGKQKKPRRAQEEAGARRAGPIGSHGDTSTSPSPGDSSPSTALTNILAGVTFALSGFKNPLRGQLREKALAMGAKYELDWGPHCSHLICAFPNTPKFNQVKAKGGCIVRKEWIIDCFSKKQKLPAARYKLVQESSDSEDSAEEEYNPPPAKVAKVQTPPTKAAPKGVVQPSASKEKEEDPYGGSTDEEAEPQAIQKTNPPTRRQNPSLSDSGGDTDEEIQRIQARQQQQQQAISKGGGASDEDDYGGSTDVESVEEETDTRPPPPPQSEMKPYTNLLDLPSFFSKYHFLLYGDFDTAERKQLARYITAFDGDIDNYMNDKVTHVITNEPWDKNFDDALEENAALCFVRPKWIYACNAKRKIVPYQPFVVVPQ